MPRGTQHRETGRLLRDGPWLVFERDEGGIWRLDAPRKADRLLGCRVQIEGVRTGFDLLCVSKIEAI